jgi:myo-inositol 2-dehydrogenase/D-chiro-inositol 1-dehydrogenase
VVLSAVDGVHSDRPLHFFLERYRQAFVDELRAFFAALAAGGPTPVGGADGLAPILIGLAARRSVAERRPVRIAEVEG